MTEVEIIKRLAPLLSQERIERIEQVLLHRIHSIQVVLDQIHDSHNISAIIRSCEAFGIGKVHLIEPTGFARIHRRITQNCHKWLEIKRYKSAKTLFSRLQTEKILSYGAMPTPGVLSPCQISPCQIPITQPIALVFGSEHFGVSKESEAFLYGRFHIPMQGFTKSLNVSVAAAISLYEITRRFREEKGILGDISQRETQKLRADFYRRSIRKSRLILAGLKFK